MVRESYNAIILEPINLVRQLIWLDAYHHYYPKTWLTREKLIGFYDTKNPTDNRHLSELVNQPLLLYMIASLETEVDGTADRAEVYNKLFDQIIHRRYSRDGQIENLKNLTEKDLREMLREIAYMIFLSGNEFVTTKEILASENMEQYLKKIGQGHLAGTLKGILISFYFKERKENIDRNEPAGIEFFHKSLQEYLTAERILGTLFDSLLNKDGFDEFVIRRPQEILMFLTSIFGKRKVSEEIFGHIEQLLDKREPAVKLLLAQRLGQHIEYLFEKDFLYASAPDDFNPIYRSMTVFSSYWRLLQMLGTNKNYLCDKTITSKFIGYHKYMKHDRRIEAYFIDIKNQILISQNMGNILFADDNMVNTVFEDCYFECLNMFDTRLSNVTFRNCNLGKVMIMDCKMEDVKFTNCTFDHLDFRDNQMKKSSFDNCEFADEVFVVGSKRHRVIFRKCSFNDRVLDEREFYSDGLKMIGCERISYVQTKEKSQELRTSITDN